MITVLSIYLKINHIEEELILSQVTAYYRVKSIQFSYVRHAPT